MGEKLTKIAEKLHQSDKKVQLIYAFNGTGKTRLSREFTRLVGVDGDDTASEFEALNDRRCLYYNAFTEDLFTWDNDTGLDAEPKLKIQPNPFIPWILKEEGKEQQVVRTFQRYTSDTLTPHFSEDFTSVRFSHQAGNQNYAPHIKISKGEESNFIWGIFYTLLEQIVDQLDSVKETQTDDTTKGTEKDDTAFGNLTHIFIDDPVSSLDENHIIELAVDLAQLIKNTESNVHYVITTHNATFYNVLHSQLSKPQGYLLHAKEDGTHELHKKDGSSNVSFSYHLHLMDLLDQAIDQQNVQKYHFTLVRNLYEKTANFLGYPQWTSLLPAPPTDSPQDKDAINPYYKLILNYSSHSKLPTEQVAAIPKREQAVISQLLKHLRQQCNYASLESESN